jgi:hypothetical protein
MSGAMTRVGVGTMMGAMKRLIVSPAAAPKSLAGCMGALVRDKIAAQDPGPGQVAG